MSKTARNRGYCAVAVIAMIAQPVSAGLITTNLGDRGDGKSVVKFTYDGSGGNTTTWTVPSGVSSLEVLVVGGGAGSSVWSSAAGSGGAYYTATYAPLGSSVNVVVGAGGTGIATTNNGLGNAGGLSSFDGVLIAYGGTLASGWGIGGTSGGYSINSGSSTVPGYAGGPSDPSNSSGGGARNPGAQGNTSHGGDGLLCSITGSATYYGGGGGANLSGASGGGLGGGGGGPAASGLPCLPGLDGFGGGAGGSWGGLGADGGDGVVLVAYSPVPEPSALVLAACGAAVGLALVRKQRR